MKKFYVFCLASVLSFSAFSQKRADGIQNLPEGTDPATDVYEFKNLYKVVKVLNFDLITQGYDDLWSKIPESGAISQRDFNIRTSFTNAADFTGEFKAAYDDYYLYVLMNITDNNIHETAISDVYNGLDNEGNIKTKDADDYFELMWSTYPIFYKDVYDTAVATGRYSIDYSVGRYATTGSYKTNWKLASTETNPVGYDDYTEAWVWEPWGPSETPWVTKWNVSFGFAGCEVKYDKISETNYTLLVAIPFETAMGGFTPGVNDSISFDIKFDDVDESTKDQGIASATWNSASNEVYWSIWYAGFFQFTDTEISPVGDLKINSDSKLSIFPNPANDNLRIKAVSIHNVEVIDV
ncbi:MAG: sugar-binding protein, partial [Bacteroidales bacterium]